MLFAVWIILPINGGICKIIANLLLAVEEGVNLNSSLVHKFYLLITLIITAITIFVGYQYIEREKEFMIVSLQNELKDAASHIERTFYRNEFAKDNNVLSMDEENAILRLNAKYQPCIDQVQKQYPNFGLGIYSRNLDRVIAVTKPTPDKLQKKKYDARYFKIYETAKIEKQENLPSIDFGNSRILNLQYPIIVNGKAIGFTWASAKTEDIQDAVNKMIFRLSLYCFLIWFISILAVRLIFNRLLHAINDLITQIKEDNTSAEGFQEIPELLPLVNTITEQRLALENAYQQRENMLVELGRINRLDLVGEMAASVAHEIRNPMTSVQGFLQFAQKKCDTKIAEYMDTALEELAHANQIIDDFLALAKNRFVEKSPEDINEIIGRLEPIIYADCMKKGIVLDLNLKKLPPVLVSTKEIKQLILNLTRNAMDAMDKNGCLVMCTDNDDYFVSVTIADNGKGIALEELESIFEPFYTTKDNGTGLGLVVCQSIIEHHGGTIKVDSKVGTGTVVTINLPVYQGE